jgi:N-[(2S)-2-amino-2-carboxyethyl]-L-glutamate dehydrogenase
VNPDSYFLRFPARSGARIIALPAYLGGKVDSAGVKWISSFPENRAAGLPRASAVLILNDYATGYPYALLESAAISAARTAASAALAARALGTARPSTVGVIGCGVIARAICRYLHRTGTALRKVKCHDLDASAAAEFSERLNRSLAVETACASLEEALQCELVTLATTSLAPYIAPAWRFRPGQLVLNISLRDLAPETLLAADNVLDDVEHCLKADTSPHLAEKVAGNRDFITGTLADYLQGNRTATRRPTIFSPFGLGVLDLAVGYELFRRAVESDLATEIPGFFGSAR